MRQKLIQKNAPAFAKDPHGFMMNAISNGVITAGAGQQEGRYRERQ
jgi:hypothetical protein